MQTLDHKGEGEELAPISYERVGNYLYLLEVF